MPFEKPYEDLGVAFDLDDESFREDLASGNGLAMIGFRVRLGDRWYLGDDDRAMVGDFLGIAGQFARCTVAALAGERASVSAMDSPVEFCFEPASERAMRLAARDRRTRRLLDDDFGPDGPLVATAAFGRALLDAIRRLLRVAWQVGRPDLDPVEGVRGCAADLRKALDDRESA